MEELVKKNFASANVSGSLSFDEGYKKGWTDATSQAINEIQKNYKPNSY